MSASGNPSIILVQQWIAAVHNFQLCPPTDNRTAIEQAISQKLPSPLKLQASCCPYSLPDVCRLVFPNIAANSEPGQQMLALADLLRRYNNAYYNDCDGDGYAPSQGDCDDSNLVIFPGASDPTDGIDNNCNGQIDEDSCPCPDPNIPSPTLEFDSMQTTTVNGVVIDRYDLNVPNYASFPDCIFVQTAALGACGDNDTPSRTWVDIYDASNDARLYGFCAFDEASMLDQIWFGLPTGTTPPAAVYIKITDRACNSVYQSAPAAIVVP